MRTHPTALTGLPLPLVGQAHHELPELKWKPPRVLNLLKSLPGLDLSRLLQTGPSVWMFEHLHPTASRWILGLVGRVYFALDKKKRQRIVASLEAFLESENDPRRLAALWSQVRSGVIDHYHEKLMLGFKPLESLQALLAKRLTIQGEEVLTQAYEQGRGVIMVTGHFGAVEYIPLSLAMCRYPLTTMVHCKSHGLRQALQYKASLFNTNLLDPKSESVLFRALQELKQGRVLITQCDELDCWRPYPNQSINFLGLDCGLDRSLDLLARKSGSPVVFGLMHREAGRRYRLSLHSVSQLSAAPKGQVARTCLELLNQNIRQEPEAWYEWAKLARLIDDTPPVAHTNHEPGRLPSKAAA
jgi:KDO2-lipid IV(A) lauroyltransferase